MSPSPYLLSNFWFYKYNQKQSETRIKELWLWDELACLSFPAAQNALWSVWVFQRMNPGEWISIYIECNNAQLRPFCESLLIPGKPSDCKLRPNSGCCWWKKHSTSSKPTWERTTIDWKIESEPCCGLPSGQGKAWQHFFNLWVCIWGAYLVSGDHEVWGNL